MSHLGRPDGHKVDKFSLKPVVRVLFGGERRTPGSLARAVSLLPLPRHTDRAEPDHFLLSRPRSSRSSCPSPSPSSRTASAPRPRRPSRTARTARSSSSRTSASTPLRRDPPRTPRARRPRVGYRAMPWVGDRHHLSFSLSPPRAWSLFFACAACTRGRSFDSRRGQSRQSSQPSPFSKEEGLRFHRTSWALGGRV